MDEVADAVQAGGQRPDFYYVEETQQNKYQCEVCDDEQDILGQFGYCSCCGLRNPLTSLKRKKAKNETEMCMIDFEI